MCFFEVLELLLFFGFDWSMGIECLPICHLVKFCTRCFSLEWELNELLNNGMRLAHSCVALFACLALDDQCQVCVLGLLCSIVLCCCVCFFAHGVCACVYVHVGEWVGGLVGVSGRMHVRGGKWAYARVWG